VSSAPFSNPVRPPRRASHNSPSNSPPQTNTHYAWGLAAKKHKHRVFLSHPPHHHPSFTFSRRRAASDSYGESVTLRRVNAPSRATAVPAQAGTELSKPHDKTVPR